MAGSFEPRFIDLVRNYSNTTGTGNVVLGSAVPGYASFTAALQPGDQFYYSIMFERAGQAEVGRGTLQSDGTIARDPCAGVLTKFSVGMKTVSLITAAEWFTEIQARPMSGEPADGDKGDITVAAGVWSLNADAPSVASKVEHFADRAALANAPSSTPVAFLHESGREGTFVWGTGDHSPLVAADVRQAMYIAPASDPTGATGVWVRKYSGAIDVRWFGTIADDASDDGPAFQAAIELCAVLKRSGAAYSYGSYGAPGLFIPSGAYFLGTTTLDISVTMRVAGEGVGQSSGPSTVLRWADGTTGIRIQSYNTTGASSVSASVQPGDMRGDGTIIEGLYLRGGYAGTESDAHGIHLRAPVVIRDCCVENFPGAGVFADTTIGSGGTTEGQSSASHLQTVLCTGNRNGLYIHGADANVWTIIGGSFIANRQWGVWDSSFLGNSYFGNHAAANGWDGARDSVPTACCYNNNRYYVKAGQASGASTNAPTGDATDNLWWGYIGPGATYNGIAAWVSGTVFREGGAYRTDNPNAANVFSGSYAESDQNPPQVGPPSIIIGGNVGIGNFGGAFGLSSDTAGDLRLGPRNGPARDSALYLDNTNYYSWLVARQFAGGASTEVAKLWFAANFGIIYDAEIAGWASHSFRVQGVESANINSAGLNLSSGKALSVNGAQVVGARQADTAADASDLASAITLVNDLKAKLTVHGLIS